jgi:pyrroloquinoline quinone biosynthesis protein E
MTALDPPLAVLAELTHRCPLRCPYCSNPLELERARGELETDEWLRVLGEAAEMGALQVHFSGGEPTVRKDLELMVEHAAALGLYSNLITAGVLLDRARIERLAGHGLDHVQLSVQDADAANADRIGGFDGGHARKLRVAEWVRAAGLPLTLNAPVHRQNIEHLDEIIDLAVALDAERLEVAHIQYYGWGLRNRAALIPTVAQLERATEIVEAARERLKGVLVFDYVIPDYYARRPKSCMGGWGRRFMNVTPNGKVLPCHAAETIPGLRFDTVRARGLAEIWHESEAFQRFRGTAWMPEPCRSCDRREIDWGGCRCQALALTGDAANTDPACALSPHHAAVLALADEESAEAPPPLVYRGFAADASPRTADRSRTPVPDTADG